jgi:hypothetical protein
MSTGAKPPAYSPLNPYAPSRLGITPREIALDGGFPPTPTNAAPADLQPKAVFIAGRQEPASRHAKRRLAGFRHGTEGRVSHLKRRSGLDRSRLKESPSRPPA